MYLCTASSVAKFVSPCEAVGGGCSRACDNELFCAINWNNGVDYGKERKL